jgi:hypothetical protein
MSRLTDRTVLLLERATAGIVIAVFGLVLYMVFVFRP